MHETRPVHPRAAAGAAHRARSAAEYAALTRRAIRDLRGVVLDLDTERREIRRLRAETREILAALA